MSHQAAADALPLRDAFAVLFFVSVGMLLDPTFLLANPLPILAVVLADRRRLSRSRSSSIVRRRRLPDPDRPDGRGRARPRSASSRSSSARSACSLGLLPDGGLPAHRRRRPPLDHAQPAPLPRASSRSRPGCARCPASRACCERRAGDARARSTRRPQEGLRLHAILCGYGRVGRMIGPALERRGFRYVVITQQRDEVDRLRARGDPGHLRRRGEHRGPARWPRSSTPGWSSSPPPTRTRRGSSSSGPRRCSPGLDFVVRTHSDAEAAHLRAIERQGPGRARRARARGPDGALRAPPVRCQRDRGRGHRPGPARPIARQPSPVRGVRRVADGGRTLRERVPTAARDVMRVSGRRA